MFENLVSRFQNLFSGDESGIKIVGDHWFARYSNAFKDRENEFFPVKAIDAYIDRVDHGVVPMPELWVWHTPIKLGKAKAIARIGLFVVAAGTFDDTPTGQAGKYYLSKNKAKLSHGFVFDVDSFKDAAYNDFNTFEISALPFSKGIEANAYTNIEVKDMAMNEEKKRFFVEMFGKEAAEELIANTEKASKVLEEIGVEFKDFADISSLKSSGNKVDEDDDKKPMVGDDVPEDEEEEKAFKSLVVDNTKSLAEIAQGQLDLLKAIKAQRAEIGNLTSGIDAQKVAFDKSLAELRQENKALRDELALSPRGTQASQSDDTTIDDKDLAKNLKDKEQGEKDPFWDFAKAKD